MNNPNGDFYEPYFQNLNKTKMTRNLVYSLKAIAGMLLATLILSLLAMVTAKAESLSSPGDTTEITYTKVYNDVKVALSGLADGLKVGAEHVYSVLVWQQTVNSITFLIVYVILLSIVWLCLNKAFKLARPTPKYEGWWNNRNPDAEASLPFLVIGGIGAVITLLTVLLTVSDVVTGFVNPEYGAIRDIIKLIH